MTTFDDSLVIIVTREPSDCDVETTLCLSVVAGAVFRGWTVGGRTCFQYSGTSSRD